MELLSPQVAGWIVVGLLLVWLTLGVLLLLARLALDIAADIGRLQRGEAPPQPVGSEQRE